jgi:hypothetical protein
VQALHAAGDNLKCSRLEDIVGKLGLLLTAGLGAMGGFVAARRLATASDRDGNEPVSAQRDQPAAPAESMQRLVHVARIRTGSEAALRRLLEEHFPVAAMAVPGLHELGVFVGNDYLLTQYGFSGEFAPVFNTFRAQPAVASYLQELGHMLDDEPAPLPDMTAMQVLASQALHWDEVGGLSFTPRVRSREAATEITADAKVAESPATSGGIA